MEFAFAPLPTPYYFSVFDDLVWCGEWHKSVFQISRNTRKRFILFPNRNMGGTDLHDQFNKYYRTTVRCNKWPIRIYTHYITSSVTNFLLFFNY